MWKPQRMERSGARWNPASPHILAKAARVRARALASGERPDWAARSIVPRQGEIVQTIIDVLRGSDVPMRPIEVHGLVEARLEREVALHTVVGRLSAGAANARSPIVRMARGRYCVVARDEQ